MKQSLSNSLLTTVRSNKSAAICSLQIPGTPYQCDKLFIFLCLFEKSYEFETHQNHEMACFCE